MAKGEGMKVYEARADFLDKDMRDSARLALHDQPIFWDGGCIGYVKVKHNTDDTTLGVEFWIETKKGELVNG